jgi:hypothetical protein
MEATTVNSNDDDNVVAWDDDVARRLDAVAGAEPMTTDGFATIRRRGRRTIALRRGSAVVGGLAAVALIGVSVASLGARDALAPAQAPPPAAPSVPTTVGSSTDGEDGSVSSTSLSTEPNTTVPVTPSEPSPTSVPPSVTVPLTPPAELLATSVAPNTSPPTVTTLPPATSLPPLPSTTAPSSAPVTQVFSCVGGQATVRVSDGAVVLVGAPQPASGWVVEEISDDGPDRVEVRFESTTSDDDSRLRIDIEDGVAVLRCD